MDIKFEDITPELLVDLSKEALVEYNADLLGNRDDYLKLVTLEILDKFNSLTENERLLASLTSVITLMVENFYLNKKIELLKEK